MRGVFLRLLFFVILIDGFYLYVGQTVTQSTASPAELDITTQTDAPTLVSMGEELVRNKGGCLICHRSPRPGTSVVRPAQCRRACGWTRG
jgi:hypothetical protein